MNEKPIVLFFEISRETHSNLLRIAFCEGRPIASLIGEAIQDLVEKKKIEHSLEDVHLEITDIELREVRIKDPFLNSELQELLERLSGEFDKEE